MSDPVLEQVKRPAFKNTVLELAKSLELDDHELVTALVELTGVVLRRKLEQPVLDQEPEEGPQLERAFQRWLVTLSANEQWRHCGEQRAHQEHEHRVYVSTDDLQPGYEGTLLCPGTPVLVEGAEP